MDYERKRDEMYRLIISILPKRLIYFTAIEMWAKTTTGKYSNTIISELTVGEAIKRYNWYYCLDE